jgi:hypothetical protein
MITALLPIPICLAHQDVDLESSENGRRSLPYPEMARPQDRRAGCARHQAGPATA